MLKSRLNWANLWVFMFALMGCTQVPYLMREDFGQRAPKLRQVAVLPPQFRVYEIGVGGSRETIQTWSEQAAANFTTALVSEIVKRRGTVFRTFSMDTMSDDQKSQVADVQGLLAAINLNVLRHVYGSEPDRIADLSENFDLSLGTDSSNLDIQGADAFLLINGVDHVSSSSRLATEIIRWSASGPVGMILDTPRLGKTWASIALTDAATGDILWYRIERSSGKYDVRNPGDAREIVRKLFTDFPIQ